MSSERVLNSDQHSDERELLEYLFEQEGLEVSGEARIAPRSSAPFIPLSFSQERLWFLDQLQPGTSAYNLALVMRASGPLQVECLRQSLSEIVRRHEMLRTRFVMGEDGPVQVIDPPGEVFLPVIDLSGMSRGQREERARQLSAEEARCPFDLGRGPLLRAQLIKLDAKEHLLVLNQHHIVSDGWSLRVMWRELGELYQAYVRGEPSPLHELELQYADYALWQRGYLTGELLKKELEFWKKQLEPVPELLDLPVDRPRPQMQSPKGASYLFGLPAPLTGDLKSLARRDNATLFMVLFAGFQTLLCRYSGQSNFAIGTPHANRDRVEIEEIIGFFINMLVLRADVSGNPTFQELISRVRERTLEVYAHHELPFEKLIEELGVDRNLGYSPLFQVGFALQNLGQPTMEFGGVSFESIPASIGATKYDLTLYIAENSGRLEAMFEYSSDLFDEQTMARMSRHFKTLLSSATASADQRIRQLRMVSVAEQRMLEAGWSGPLVQPMLSATLCSLVAEHAVRNPADTALITSEGKISYGELNRRANQLAHSLRRRGLDRGVVTGICLDGATEVLVAALAVMKAGGVMAPLEVDEPGFRRLQILRSAELKIVITRSALEEQFKEYSIDVLCMDRDTVYAELERESGEELASGPETEDLACVLYRSSQTGRPEGVLLQHRALVAGSGLKLAVAAADRIAQSVNFSEETGCLDLFHALAAGACIVELAESSLPPRKLADMVRRNAATVLRASATTLERFVREFRQALKGVRLILCPELPSSMQRLREALKDEPEICSRIHGITGATESGGFWEVVPFAEISELISTSRAPHLAAGCRFYLLEESLEAAPEGVVGEIYLATGGEALGYRSSPEITAETFIPDAFSGTSGGRLYATGEIARRRSSGELEFRGHKSGRTLVNGVRIEPEEIERALMEYPGIRDAGVVLLDEADAHKTELTALIAADAGIPQSDEFQRFVAERFPKHMLPRRYVPAGSVPRSGDGCIDRRALRRMAGLSGSSAAAPFQAPRNPIEESLAKIWAEIFGREQIGIYDNFFTLGGDSILSILAVTRAHRAGIQITARQMFERQTIAGLAAVAGQVELAAAEQGALSGSVPLTPPQRWFFEQEFYDQHHFNQAVMLATRKKVDSNLLRQAAEILLQHHDALRMRFSRDHVAWRQEIAPQEDVARVFARVELASQGSEWQTRLQKAASEFQASLNLQSGPLLRVVLFDGEEQRVLIAIHHLVIDGVSWRILIEDLERVCRQLQSGEPLDLGAKTASYRQWALQLEKYAETAEVKQETEYWRKVVSTPFKPLPRDHPTSDNTVNSAATVAIAIEKERTRSLLQEVPQAYRMQMHEVLLAAFALAIRDWAAIDIVRIDLEGHGREEIGGNIDVTRTVGWFTAIFPVLFELQGISDPGSVLKRIKEQLRATPERGLGFGLLRFLNREELLRQPAAEASFNYLGQFDQVLEASGLFQGTNESHGELQSPGAKRPYLLEINAAVQDSRLHVECTYSANVHLRESVEILLNIFSAKLEMLIGHCQTIVVGGYTPSDFRWVKVSQEFLDSFPEAVSEIENIYPLISMQEDMLLHSVRAPGIGIYFEQLVFGVEGLKPEIFQRAWQHVIDRHAALRTRFAWEGLERPVQIVLKRVKLELEREDWSSREKAGQAALIEEFLLRDRARGFLLSQAPLMRITFIRTGRSDWIVWSFHHILLDGWSGPILMQEVFACYHAMCQGREPQSAPSVDYGEYIRWRQRRNQGELEKYWRPQLKGFPRPQPLGVENQNGLPAAVDIGREKVQFSEDAIKALDGFARQRQLTLNTVVQGMWSLVLCAYTGNMEVAFGAWGSGRSADVPEIEKIVGALINTLPVHTRVDAAAELSAWLKEIQAQQIEHRQHENVDLLQLAEWADISRGSLMFNTVLVFENYPVSASLGGQITESGVRILDVMAREQTQYPITVRIMPRLNLTLLIEYDQHLYTRDTARKILGAFQRLLQAIAENPEYRIQDLLSLLRSQAG